MRLSFYLATLVICTGVASGAAAEISDLDFTYATPDAKTTTPFGVGKKNATYDVAMQIKNPSLTGYQITGIRVPVPATGGECYPEVSAWLASRLVLPTDTFFPDSDIPDTSFHPDVEIAFGEITNYGTDEEPDYQIRIDFNKPYTLTDEGIFVGYTISVKTLKNSTQKYPVAVVQTENAPGSLWVHCPQAVGSYAQYAGWGDRYNENRTSSAMTVRLRGPYADYSAAASLGTSKPILVKAGATAALPVVISNFGRQPIESFEYTFTGQDHKEIAKETCVLPTPVPPYFGASASVTIDVPGAQKPSEEILSLSITSVNGHPNENMSAPAEVTVNTRRHLPVHRPLVEEGTGLWCRYCPEAYVKVHQLQDIYPDDVNTLVYHIYDKLQSLSMPDMPLKFDTPSLFVDRKPVYNFDLLQDAWEERRREFAPAEISVKLYWTDETRTILRPEATVNFALIDPEEEYRIGFALVEDGITGPEYAQTNDFYGWQSKEGPYWDLFKTSPSVEGLVFNDILMALPDPFGREGSLPDILEPDWDYKYYVDIDPAECINQYTVGAQFGKPIVNNPANLRAVAFLVNPTTNEVFNSATSGHAADAEIYASVGISGVTDGQIPVLTEFFTLSGQRLPHAPAGEPYIVVNHYKDGSVSTAKYLHPLQ